MLWWAMKSTSVGLLWWQSAPHQGSMLCFAGDGLARSSSRIFYGVLCMHWRDCATWTSFRFQATNPNATSHNRSVDKNKIISIRPKCLIPDLYVFPQVISRSYWTSNFVEIVTSYYRWICPRFLYMNDERLTDFRSMDVATYTSCRKN